MKISITLLAFLLTTTAWAFDMSSLTDKVKDKASSESSSGAGSALSSAAEQAKLRAKRMFTKININSASEEDLQTLPGIGPVKARAIVDKRPYDNIDEIKKVPGISDDVFKKLKGKIVVK